MNSRIIRWAIGLFGIAFGLAGEAVAYNGGRSASATLLDLAIGWTYLFGGLVIWGREPRNRTGALMAFVGLTWFLGSLALSTAPGAYEVGVALGDTSTVALIALVLAYPLGRLESRVDRVAVTAIVIAATLLNALQLWPGPIVVNEGVNGLYVGLTIAFVSSVVVVRRWFVAPARSRRDLLPVLVAGGVLLLSLTINLVRRIALVPDDAGALLIAAKDIAPALIPIALLIGFYRQSESRLRALVDAIPDAMIRFTRDGQVPGDNAPMFDATRAGMLAKAREALDTGRLQSYDFSLDSPSGRRDYEARIAQSGADEVTAIVRDFTAQRAAEAELRRSPARIVEATDAERRRLERDLHDGAQQRLVSLVLAVRQLRGQLGAADGPNAEAIAAVDRVTGELRTALAELRELARGIHPAILTEAGLGAAIASLADRSSVAATVTALPDRRLPPAVEATAYFVVSEALANVAKYASATEVTVSAQCPDGVLTIDIRDDGVGGADAARGTGLRGLRDRVAALGGELTIDSPAGRGTRVVARIPIAGA